MAAREVVNESSAMTVLVEFDQLPNTMRYLIKDVTNDRLVRDWTELPAAQHMQIDVIASDNDIFENCRRPFEERVLTVQANFGTSLQAAEEIRYLIKDLQGFDS